MKLKSRKVFRNIRRRQPTKWLLAWLISLCLLPSGSAWALDPGKSLYQFNCRNWTHESGLPADTVTSVIQTKDGYIWLGTTTGLLRFDGQEFASVANTLPVAQGQNINHLLASRDGSLWFAINGGGFGKFDGRVFSGIKDAPWSQTGMNATTLMEARDGTIWTGGEFGWGRWSPIDSSKTFFDGSTNLSVVLSLCEDSTGNVWLGTSDNGLFCWQDGKVIHSSGNSLNKNPIPAVAAGGQNQIWVGTANGLCVCSNGVISKVPAISASVAALLLDRHGVLWVATVGMGLARIANGAVSFLSKADGLAGDTLTCLCEDAEGSLWVGTREGLSQLSDLKFPIYSQKNGLPEGSIHSVHASRSGGFWAGGENGLAYFDGTNAVNYSDDSLIPGHYAKLCFEARNEDVYVEDGNRNLDIISNGHLLSRLTNSMWVSAISEDARSVVLGMGTGHALYRLLNGQLRPYGYREAPGPDYYWINNLYTARDGAIWVASKNGAYRLEAGQVKHWGVADGLSGDNVLWIMEDDSGSVWLGLATGMARIKNGQIKSIRPENGLPDNWVYAIEPDALGNFWCSSSRGIFRVARKSLNDFADGKAGGVSAELFSGREAVKSTGRTDQEYSGCKTADGRIWFPSPWGVVMIDPGRVTFNPVPPPVHISKIVANGRPFAHGQNVVVPPGPGQLEFDFAGLTFIAPEKTRYRYRLEGFESDWVDSADRRQAFYTNLRPGHYTFRVMAANADGLWSERGDALDIELRPFLYQTAGFYYGCGGLGIAILAGIYLWRVRHLESRQRSLQYARDHLERVVSERTSELAAANSSLQHEVEEHRQTGAQLAGRTQSLEKEMAQREVMQNEMEGVNRRLLEMSRQAGMAEVATNVLHNVGNVLNSVNISASLVAESTKRSRVSALARVTALLDEHAGDLGNYLTKDAKGSQLPAYLNQLGGHLIAEQQNVLKELEVLRQNVEHIKEIVAMQQTYAKISGVTEIVKASDLVEDAVQMVFGASTRTEYNLTREFGEVPPLVVEKHKVLQILVNIIRNAKNACDDSAREDKQLTFKIAVGEGTVRMEIMDNGVGIAPENMTRIFHFGFTTRQGGHGFGLHSGALAATELGGALTVQSDGVGYGATFCLELPLQPPKP